jgi:hypothetical protein
LQVADAYRGPWLAGGGSTVRGVSNDDECMTPYLCGEYEIGGKKVKGAFAVMADGKVRFIPETIDKKVFRAMCTINAAKIENVDDLAPQLNEDGEVVGAAKVEEPKKEGPKPEEKKPEDKKSAPEEKKPEGKKPAPAEGGLKGQLIGKWMSPNPAAPFVFEFTAEGGIKTSLNQQVVIEGTFKVTGDDEIELTKKGPGQNAPEKAKVAVKGDELTIKMQTAPEMKLQRTK